MIQTPYKEYMVTWLKHYTHIHTCFRRKTKHGNLLIVMMHPVCCICSSIIFIILESLWFRAGNENILS